LREAILSKKKLFRFTYSIYAKDGIETIVAIIQSKDKTKQGKNI
jgi:hypothetical protein